MAQYSRTLAAAPLEDPSLVLSIHIGWLTVVTTNPEEMTPFSGLCVQLYSNTQLKVNKSIISLDKSNVLIFFL